MRRSASEQRDPATRDGRAAGAAVRLDDVAVDGHGPLTQDGGVDHAPQRPADEPLDLVRAAAQLALGALALAALGRGAGQHRVLGGDPAGALAPQVRRDAVLDGRGAQHVRAADPDDHGRGGPLLDVQLDGHRPHLGRRSSIVPEPDPTTDAHLVPSCCGLLIPSRRFLAFDVLPQLIERVEPQRLELQVPLPGQSLDTREPARELATRRPQRGLGVDAQLARHVDEHEHQVTVLLDPVRLVGRRSSSVASSATLSMTPSRSGQS